MPKAIIGENSSGIIQNMAVTIRGFIPLLKSTCLKMNVVELLRFEITNYLCLV